MIEAPYSGYARYVYEMHCSKESFTGLAFVAIQCAIKVLQNVILRSEVSECSRPERRFAALILNLLNPNINGWLCSVVC